MLFVDNVLVTCPCGMIPLDKAQHRNAQDAWAYLAQHVALNPTLCAPNMTRVSVPEALSR